MVLETGRIYLDNMGSYWRCLNPNMFRAELMWCRNLDTGTEVLFFLSGLGYTTAHEGRHIERDATSEHEAAEGFNDWYANDGYLADRL